jgi:glycosyltransferase involved in cell wall biosynthesis
MRILMAVPKYPFPVVGGQERQAHELGKVLARRGHAVNVLSSRFNASQRSEETIDGVHIHRQRWIENRFARFALAPFGLALRAFRLRRAADLVHVHNISWFGAFVTVVAKALGLPVITKLPNTLDFGIPGMRGKAFGALRIALLKWSDVLIAMTGESAAEAASIGFPAARVLKVTNGVPLLARASHRARSAAAALRVVYVGSLASQKGLVDLLHAWSAVHGRTACPMTLRILGDGPQAAELRDLAVALGLAGSVEFLGYCADVPAELDQADLFVLPSYREGNSNAILEAMRAGLPIVATRVGGAAAQVGEEGQRFLVEPGDRDALRGRLLELIGDAPLRERLGAAMRARIEEHFTIDRVAAIYESAYDLVATGRRDQVGLL